MQTPRGTEVTGGGGGGRGLKVCRWSFLIKIKNLKITFSILYLSILCCVRFPCGGRVKYFPCADGCQASAGLCQGPGGLVSGTQGMQALLLLTPTSFRVNIYQVKPREAGMDSIRGLFSPLLFIGSKLSKKNTNKGPLTKKIQGLCRNTFIFIFVSILKGRTLYWC